jgi:hypothetical protein
MCYSFLLQHTQLLRQEWNFSPIKALQAYTTWVVAASGKFKRYRSPDVYQIPVELIQTGGETLHSEINYVDLEQRQTASAVERVNCHTYSQKQ